MNASNSLITDTLKAFFLQYPLRPIVVAYSGGVDSQVLLHGLAQLSQQKVITNPIRVCHVNHGLSDNALAWQDFAEQQCQKFGFELSICQVNVNAKPQQSLEALARDARYKALKNICQAMPQALIVTGHHGDDQAETFLLALKRGAGLKGLSAMAVCSSLGEHLLVRPLLSVSRQVINDYAKKHQLLWVEDESNQDLRFDRNFIRHQVMPLLTERWPSMLTTISRSAEHCQSGQLLLDEMAQEDLSHCLLDAENRDCLSVEAIKSLSLPRFNNLIRYFLEQQKCLMPSTEQLQQLHQQINAQADKNPAVKVGDKWLRRFKGGLYLTEDYRDLSTWQVELDVESKQNIALPDELGELFLSKHDGAEDTACFYKIQVTAPDFDSTSEPTKVSIRFSHNNPKCLPDYRQQSRPLKKVLQELVIPSWQRKRIPFLYYNNELVAALGHFVCQKYLPKSEDKKLMLFWNKP